MTEIERTSKVTALSKPDEWIKYLETLDAFVSDNLISLAPKLTPAQASKCHLSKWYLFAVKNWQVVVVDMKEREMSI
jgi:hypothetical protein